MCHAYLCSKIKLCSNINFSDIGYQTNDVAKTVQSLKPKGVIIKRFC